MMNFARSRLTLLPAMVKNTCGQSAIIFALVAASVTGIAGTAIDYNRASQARALLQQAGDAGVLAAVSAKESSDAERSALAENLFAARLAASGFPIQSIPVVTVAGDTAEIKASATIPTVILGLMQIETITVSATSSAVRPAQAFTACVVALDPVSDDAVSLVGTADLNLSGCALQANSISEQALSTTGNTTAKADAFCSGGGYSGDNFVPEPITGCPPLPDPFAALPTPTTWGCDHSGMQFGKGSHTAYPGVYCGGMDLKTHADVTLEPGIYVIKNGALSLSAHSILSGTGVVFWLTGENAIVNIRSQATIDISAPVSGDYAGVAIAQDPHSPDEGQVSSIEGGGSIKLVGSIYLPTQNLKVGGGGEVGLASRYMPLVAKTFTFHGNAQITINLDASGAGMPEDAMPPLSTGQVRLAR